MMEVIRKFEIEEWYVVLCVKRVIGSFVKNSL